MSGVTTGTRLERLYKLRDRIALEIRAEELAKGTPRTSPTPTPATAPPVGLSAELRGRIRALGVTPGEVNRWARRAGFFEVIPPGRISIDVMTAYLDAHQGSP